MAEASSRAFMANCSRISLGVSCLGGSTGFSSAFSVLSSAGAFSVLALATSGLASVVFASLVSVPLEVFADSAVVFSTDSLLVSVLVSEIFSAVASWIVSSTTASWV